MGKLVVQKAKLGISPNKRGKNLELLKFPLSLLVASDQVGRLHGDLQQTALRQHVRRSLKSVTHSLI